jgi:MinD-like ATPase involved in chromosome partitioning or flagellar assembly
MHSLEPFSGARSRTRRRTRCKAGTLSHTSRTPTVITVTSADSRAGRTTVTVNLAVALAERGRHVLVLDADVARPNVCALLGFEHQSGIHDLLTGVRTLDEVLVVGPRGVYLVPGTMRERSELGVLEQAALIWAIDAMRQRIDVLLIDTAAGHRSEVATFARAAHHVLVVLRDGPASADRTLAFITCLSREHAVHHYKVLASQTLPSQPVPLSTTRYRMPAIGSLRLRSSMPVPFRMMNPCSARSRRTDRWRTLIPNPMRHVRFARSRPRSVPGRDPRGRAASGVLPRTVSECGDLWSPLNDGRTRTKG